MWKRRKNNKDILVFLDIDGVLNTTNSRITKYEIKDENVKALKALVDRLNKQGYMAKIVLSSTWRLGYDCDFEKCSRQIQNLISKLEKEDVTIFDKTPVYKEKTRDIEILRYIRGYGLKNEEFEYVILDDDITIFDKDALREMNFYKVNEYTGLTTTDVEKIMKFLK